MIQKQTIKILYLEDNPDDIFLLENTFKKSGDGVELTSVNSREDFEASFIKSRPDLVISDYKLHGYNGLDALLFVREQDEILPFMFLSGTLGEERAVQLMLKGANDLVLKENISKVPKLALRLMNEAEDKSEKIKYQQELEQKNNILRTLLKSMEDFIFLKDENQRYIMVNEAMCRHFNIAMETFIGARDEELFPLEQSIKSSESDDYVLTNKKPILFETDYIDSDGRKTVMETLKTPLQDRYGETRGIVGVSRDISLKKIQEEKIRRNEELLNEAEKQSKLGSFQYKVDTDTLKGSRQFFKMLGFSEGTEEISLTDLISCIYQAEKSIFVKNINTSIREESLFTMDHRLIGRKNNEITQCRTTLTPTNQQGIFYGSIQDIHEDRENKEAIINAQENERNELAAELHDGLTQKLVAANMYLSSMDEKKMSIERIKTAAELIRAGLEETRRLTRSLSLHNFENLGFKNALLEIIESFPTNVRINHEFDFNEKELNRDISIALYRVIQEALTNIMKYARASTVGIIINAQEDSLRCKIIDDGVGFETKVEETQGNGLKNMRQRILRCNGIMKINSSRGEGTSIDISVPYK